MTPYRSKGVAVMENTSSVVVLDEGVEEVIEEIMACCKATGSQAALRTSTK